MQEEKCTQFIKNLDGYAQEILLERRKIELQLQGTIEKLRKAKKKQNGFWRSVFRGIRDTFDFFSNVPIIKPFAKLGAELGDMALNLMGENTKKYEKNVKLLEQALEIYSIQARASKELVDGAWESVKKILGFYTHKHQEFIKRLNYVSEAIDNQYISRPQKF
ncbi:hypothetical protein HpCK38_03540 [Helicobacter pylori]